MRLRIVFVIILIGLLPPIYLNRSGADHSTAESPADVSAPGVPRKVGNIRSDRIVECSGIAASRVDANLLWAINDGGNEPCLFAVGSDGRDRGCIRIDGAENRDWEDLATFVWRGRAMILVADFGDNHRRYATHTLYLVEEPRLEGERFQEATVIPVAWRIDFAYPDGRHDAEAVAVDEKGGWILILTKRDEPPLLFALPLKPATAENPTTARRVAPFDRIPPPTQEDLLFPYGRFRSQPTAMDLSSDGQNLVVLTYKDAYLLHHSPGESWETTAARQPKPIPLPLPQYTAELRQREAICFSRDGDALFITSEGRHPGLFSVTTGGDRSPKGP